MKQLYYVIRKADTTSLRITRLSMISLLSLLVSLTVQGQTVRYVSTSGSNPNPATATTWATSTTNLQGAINASGAGDQVWVATGTYKPGGNSNTDRSLSFSLQNGVAIYGGFAGTESSLTDRPDVNPRTAHTSGSVLSGYLTDGNSITAVVVNKGVNNTAQLDGFVITGGYNTTSKGGGGMYNENSSPQLRNLMISSNDAFYNGGGMYNTGSSPSLTNCLLRENGADNGGGMYNTASSPSFTNCAFEANYSNALNSNGAEGGAGMYNTSNSNPILMNCSFRSNENIYSGHGGGMFNSASSPRLTDCTFQENIANGRGGGIYNTSRSNTMLTNCTFQGNLAGEGGGMANEADSNGEQSNPVLTNCSFLSNESIDFGGGMHTLNSSPTLINCTFLGNKTRGGGDPVFDLGGGGLFIGGSGNAKVTNCIFQNNRSGYGGGVSIFGATTGTPTLTGCTFQSNSATTGGGMYCEAAPTNTRLTSCIFQSNSATSGAGIYNLTSSPFLTNCSFQANSATSGGGMYNTGGAASSPRHPYNGFSKPTVTNCSFQANTATTGRGIYNTNASEVTLSNDVLFGNGGVNAIVNGVNSTSGLAASKVSASYCLFEPNVTGYTGPSNLTATVSPFASTTSTQLAPCSPAIDAGDPNSTTTTSGTTDLAGNPRFYNGGRIDMGAYERQSTQSVGITQQPASGTSVNAGTTVTLSVSTTGVVNSYQWYKNNQVLTGVVSATTATLSLPTVQLSNAGNYVVVVTGICASLTSTAFSLTVTQPVYAIRYVRPNGSGDGSGSSWSNASGDLPSQINAPGVQQIWVAEGTYKPSLCTACSNADRSISFAMKNGVVIYGGFPNNGTPALTDRNPQRFSTILSGDIGAVGDRTDNTQAIVSNSGLDPSAVLDGFTIQDAYTTTNGGGGFYNTASSPTLINCIITGNEAVNGGGMVNTNGSNPRLINCTIAANSAQNGGGLYNSGNSSPTLVNCLISANSASQGSGGGGMLNVTNSNPQLVNCTLTANTASSGAGGMANASGSHPGLLNCIVWNNGGANTFINQSASSITASYCLLEPSETDYTGTNNLNTTTSPFASTTSAQLAIGSPAINAGNNAGYASSNGPTFDLAGNLRLQGGTIDIGAYEFRIPPDLTQILTTSPGILYGSTPFTLVVDVYELNTTQTSGLVTIYITKDPLLNLAFNGTAAVIGNKMVKNSDWTFDGTSSDTFYLLTTRQAVEAGRHLSVGLTGVIIPGNTQGSLTVSATLAGTTGDEQYLDNNTDSDKIDYFKK